MPYSKTTVKLILILALLFPFIPGTVVFAQFKSTDVSNVYQMGDTQAQDGDIVVSTTDKGIVRATTSYDSHLFGVLQEQPLLVFRRVDNQGQPITRNGTTQVNVTTLNGPINSGDYVTSSDIPGKGQKADLSGYVIGVAVNSFGENDGQKIDYQSPSDPKLNKQVASGKVTVALKIEYAELSTPRSTSRALDTFSMALFKNVQDPDKFVQVLRYLAAAAVVLISLGVGFYTFSRSIPKGVEAIGRNPLAEKAIMFSIVLNIIFTVLTAGIGVVVAVFILRL